MNSDTPFTIRRKTTKPHSSSNQNLSKASFEKPKIIVRCMEENEIEEFITCCKHDNPYIGVTTEIILLYIRDPKGFFVALNQHGRIVGTCIAFKASFKHIIISGFSINPNYAEDEIGPKLCSFANSYGEKRMDFNIPKNRLFNFPELRKSNWTIHRYETQVSNIKIISLINNIDYSTEKIQLNSNSLYSKQSYDAMEKFDNYVNMVTGDKFYIRKQTDTSDLKCVLMEDSEAVGCGCVFKSEKDWLLGPLYARESFGARYILNITLSHIKNESRVGTVVAYVVSTNKFCRRILINSGFIRTHGEWGRNSNYDRNETTLPNVYALSSLFSGVL